jgi:aspartate/methionine/tyrosine aminotransferase
LSRKELEGIAAIAEEKDLIVISDEVYERSVFDPALEHVRLATIGNMRDRTVTIGSASKLLNLTGWRVGWAVGPPTIIDAIKSAHGLMSYAAPTPLQLGVAAALNEISADETAPRGRVVADENAAVMATNARTLARALEDAGLTVYHPDGGYFLTCEVSTTGLSDVDFCVELASRAKVAAVPLSVFFLPADDVPASLVRFAVCKKPDTVRESADRIRRYFTHQ